MTYSEIVRGEYPLKMQLISNLSAPEYQLETLHSLGWAHVSHKTRALADQEQPCLSTMQVLKGCFSFLDNHTSA